MRLLLILLAILILVPFTYAVGVGCNGKCDIMSDCGTDCQNECTSKGYLCCGGLAYIPGDFLCCNNQLFDGQCCTDADCDGGTCQNNVCIIFVDEPVCGDDVCDEVENCDNCPQDCMYSEEVCCSGAPYEGDCCSDADCLSNECTNHICAPLETCSDGIKNQDETDVDCGGTCDSCANGDACTENSDCISNYCTLQVCAETPVCLENEKRTCTASNSCQGNITCTNNAWSQCTTNLNFCDANCDGTNDACQGQQCTACACIENDDCAEKTCMTSLCQGTSKTCQYTNITSCLDGDNCCPALCNWRLDNDCNVTDECTSNEECLDNILCTIDVCEGSPKTCAHHNITQCYSGDGCCPNNCTFSGDMDCSCTPNWVCGEWNPEECPREKRQKRECQDSNNCTNRTSVETRLCSYLSKTPLAGQSASSSAKMLTRTGSGNNTNATSEEQSSSMETKVSQNMAWLLILIIIVIGGLLYLMYHEGLLQNLFTMRSREEARRANMLKRIRLFCSQRQSFVMIKTNLIAEGYTLDEIYQGIEEYEHEVRQ